MNGPHKFLAPWSGWLIGLSLFASGILVAVPGLVWAQGKAPAAVAWGVGLVCLFILFTSALFTIRGYTIAGRVLGVRRLFWHTRIELAGLQRVERDPSAWKRSLRLCGNGGLFSFSGWFYNRRLGLHRWYVTDPKRLVVLKFDRRTLVVSPDCPEEFIRQISRAGGLAES